MHDDAFILTATHKACPFICSAACCLLPCCLISLSCQQPCPEYTTTPDVLGLAVNTSENAAAAEAMLFTSVSNCSNLPGYGWEHGIAAECPAGYYSAGFDLRWVACLCSAA
jgi:hypothetical protein